MESSCDNPIMLSRPKKPTKGETERTDQEKGRDIISDDDVEWLKGTLGPNWDSMSSEEILTNIRALNKPGKEACKEQEGTYRPYALCCLGPEEEIRVPTLGYRLVRKQEVIILNVFSCQQFIEGRPFCLPAAKYAYCCKDRDSRIMTDWGYKAFDCVHLLNPPEPWLFQVRKLKAEPNLMLC